MAWIFRACMLLLVANAVGVSCISSRELDSMLDSLRVRGYDLFCNAIVTSDLQFDLFTYQNQNQNQREEDETNNNTNNSFTFFAPTDASLFALDMTQTASSYIDTLRFHVVPRRLSLAQLRLLPHGYTLPTLLPQRRLHLTRRPFSATIAIAGVDIAFPGLFYGRHVAVHGLSGILTLRSNALPSNNPPSHAPVVPPVRSADRRYFSPRSSPNSPQSQTVLAPSPRPVPKLVSFNVTSQRGSRPLVEAPAPGPTAVTRQAPAASPVNGTVNDAPEPEPDWTVQSPADSPVATPMVSPPRFPNSAISLAPVGNSYAAVPTPVGLDLWVGKKDSNSLMETFTVMGDSNSREKSEALDGVRNCVTPDDNDDDDVSYMQCYAA